MKSFLRPVTQLRRATPADVFVTDHACQRFIERVPRASPTIRAEMRREPLAVIARVVQQLIACGSAHPILDRSQVPATPASLILDASCAVFFLVRDECVITCVTVEIAQRQVLAGTWAPEGNAFPAVFNLRLPETPMASPPQMSNRIDPRQLLANTLRQRREARGLSRKVVADRLRVSVPLLERFERGDETPAKDVWIRYGTRVERGLRNFDDTWRAARAAGRTSTDAAEEPLAAVPAEVAVEEVAVSLLPPVRADTFGEAHRRVREACGDTQGDLAQTFGLHANAIGAWENGSALPVAENIAKVIAMYPELAPWAPYCQDIPKPVGAPGSATGVPAAPAPMPMPMPAPAPVPMPAPAVTVHLPVIPVALPAYPRALLPLEQAGLAYAHALQAINTARQRELAAQQAAEAAHATWRQAEVALVEAQATADAALATMQQLAAAP